MMKAAGPAADTVAGGVAVALALLVVYVAATRGAPAYSIERARAVRSTVDGLPYRVHPAHGGGEAAADVLAELNRRAVALMRHLRKKYLRRAGAPPARAAAARRLLARYNPDNLTENSPRDPGGDTSYTIDKGAVLALCLRAKTPGAAPIHDLELLTFVNVHELAHIAVDVHDHPPEFWRVFKFLLLEATAAGVMRGVDYARRPARYCGVVVDYNPMYDAGLKAI